MQITVLSVSKNQMMSKAGKPYTQLEIAYKGEDGQVKGKKLMPFGDSKAAFEGMQAANSGEFWDVTPVKEGEFWVWTNVKKSDGSSIVSSTTQTTTTSNQTQVGGKVVGSNYETKEERAHRQVLIVRQSSLGHAVEYKGSKASIEDIISTAKTFEDYVFGNVAASSPAHQALMDMENDVPL
jgi:hypothetical protein